MKQLKAWAVVSATTLLLSACTTSGSAPVLDSADPRYATLLNMSPPDFYGTLKVAFDVSDSCPAFKVDRGIDVELNERRSERGNGSFSAAFQRQAIRNAQASMSQEFSNKHGGNLCDAAIRDFEQAREPYTFFLKPVG